MKRERRGGAEYWYQLAGKEQEMDEVDVEHRLTCIEARAKSNTHRLDKLEPIVNEIHTMSNTMVQLVQEVKHTNETVGALDEKIDRMDGRVDEMERAPADNVKNYKMTAVTAIISTVVGALVAAAIGILM